MLPGIWTDLHLIALKVDLYDRSDDDTDILSHLINVFAKNIFNMADEVKSDKDYAYSQDRSVEAQEAPREGAEYDAVFGQYREGQVHYKSVGW